VVRWLEVSLYVMFIYNIYNFYICYFNISFIVEYYCAFSNYRKVQNESSTGSSTSNRIRTTLTIRIENIDFDTQACVLRLKGRNIAENQYVKVSVWKYMMGYFWLRSFARIMYIKVIFYITF
jgi:hypothetical protein